MINTSLEKINNLISKKMENNNEESKDNILDNNDIKKTDIAAFPKFENKNNEFTDNNASDDSDVTMDLDDTELVYSIYDLPYRWFDECDTDQINDYSEEKLKVLNEKYDKVIDNLRNKIITLKDILLLDNLTTNEMTMLVEEFCVLRSCEDYLAEYLSKRDSFEKLLNSYKNNSDTKEDKEKLELISEKLKKIGDNNFSIKLLEKKILSLNLPLNKLSIIYNKFRIMSTMAKNGNEYHKLRNWIDYAIKIPAKIKNFNIDKNNRQNINHYLCDIKNKLDKKLYGMDIIKEELLFIINNKITNPNISHNTIAFSGQPGVGKTHLARSLAGILNLPFFQISLGGLNDSSYLDGHSYTYEGARPGKIVDALIEMQYKNGIIFFDEFDKLAKSKGGQEVSNLLLHITDFTQNSQFCDKYLSELPIDLSKIWFIFALNDKNNIDPILKNRMNIIEIPEYTENDKISILKDYILPKTIKSVNMEEKIIIDEEEIKYIIAKTKKEFGVRNLERSVNCIVNKINILSKTVLDDGTFGNLNLSFIINDFKLPLKLNKMHIDILLKNTDTENKLWDSIYI